MKQIVFIVVMFLGLMNISGYSQDKLIKSDSSSIEVKILEITQTEIKYKKFDNLDGPLFTISKTDISRIVYQNGTSETITPAYDGFGNGVGYESAPEPEVPKSKYAGKSNFEMFTLGKNDASMNYRGSGAFWGGFWSTVFVPPVGFIGVVIAGGVHPKLENTNPDEELIKNESYKKGYTQKLRTKKWGKLWSGFGIALAVDAVAYYSFRAYVH